MNVQWIFGWWNLIFIVPFALALMYLGVYTLSGWTFGDADVDADADADVDHDIDVDPDADVDADVDHDMDIDADAHIDAGADTDADADTDTDHDADHDGDGETDGPSQPSTLLAGLGWLGLGKVPASILLMVLAMVWGFVGFVTNQAAREPVAKLLNRSQPALVALASVPLAGVASLLITSTLSRLFARVMPRNETYARRRHELLGSTGEAIYDITNKFGMVNLRDDRGTLFQVPCRLEREAPTIHKGARVKLVGYSAKEQLFYIVPVHDARTVHEQPV